jgi:uncharacterized iron-regulated protein
MMHRRAFATALLLAASPWPLHANEAAWPNADLLLVGEQHDADAHQRLAAQVVTQLARQGRLAALALEMAEQGRSTAALPADATEPQAREALGWDDRGWPWAAYGPIVMAALRAGVAVHGANLPRAAMREAMQDASLDARVPAPVREQLEADVRDGHCGLLPAVRLPAMTRVQIGRDRAMADTLRGLARPGRVAMLVAGAMHIDASRGVPLHLAGSGLSVRTVRLGAGAPMGTDTPGYDETWPTPPLPAKDHCAELRQQLEAKPDGKPA